MAHLSNLLSTLSLIFLLIPIKLVYSQLNYTNCSITPETYAPNSIFHQNLKVVLSNLTFAASTTKSTFQNASFGQNNDTVYSLYLCRGDLTPEACSSCVSNATQNITKECSSNRESIRWVPECMLRYANRNIFSIEEESPPYIWRFTPAVKPPKNATPSPPPIVGFNLTKAVYDQINETAFSNNSSPTTVRYYSTREFNASGGWSPQMIYSLAQCTPDISPLMCQKCLTRAYEDLRGSTLSLAYFPSCHLRNDITKFYGIEISGNPPTQPDIGNRPQNGLRKRGSSIIAIAVSIPSTVAVILLLFAFFWLRSKLNTKTGSKSEVITMESLQYDVATIKAAVNNFSESNKIGHGGFGDVYKGTLQNGQEIAVKRLSRTSNQGFEELKTEVYLVAKLQHKNLVRLLGFCVTEEEKLLIYEYLPNSSLERLLFDPIKRATLDWKTRYKIIDGVARGLLYLHEDSRYKIVHRDLKPENILLDKDMNPKISDFGLAKLFQENQEQNFTKRIAGTRGYMAPECRRGDISVKSDVYSFGVIVLEIVSGRRVRDRAFYTSEDENLLQCAWRVWNAKEPLELVDLMLCGEYSDVEATRCIHIGLLCTQDEAEKRPTMASIVSLLDSYSSNLPQLPTEGYSKSDKRSSPEEQGLDKSTSKLSGREDITVLTPR